MATYCSLPIGDPAVKLVPRRIDVSKTEAMTDIMGLQCDTNLRYVTPKVVILLALYIRCVFTHLDDLIVYLNWFCNHEIVSTSIFNWHRWWHGSSPGSKTLAYLPLESLDGRNHSPSWPIQPKWKCWWWRRDLRSLQSKHPCHLQHSRHKSDYELTSLALSLFYALDLCLPLSRWSEAHQPPSKGHYTQNHSQREHPLHTRIRWLDHLPIKWIQLHKLIVINEYFVTYIFGTETSDSQHHSRFDLFSLSLG